VGGRGKQQKFGNAGLGCTLQGRAKANTEVNSAQAGRARPRKRENRIDRRDRPAYMATTAFANTLPPFRHRGGHSRDARKRSVGAPNPASPELERGALSQAHFFFGGARLTERVTLRPSRALRRTLGNPLNEKKAAGYARHCYPACSPCWAHTQTANVKRCASSSKNGTVFSGSTEGRRRSVPHLPGRSGSVWRRARAFPRTDIDFYDLKGRHRRNS